MSGFKYVLERLCIICRTSYPYPLDDGWTTVSTSQNSYWRCPKCTQDSKQLEQP